MKRIIVIAATVAFTGLPVAAQQTQSSASQSFEGQNTSISVAQGGGVVIEGGPSETTNRIITSQAGTADSRIENTPGMGGIALGGGHPCQHTPMTGQIVAPGFGIGAGGGQIDEACMLMVMGAANGDVRYQNAANYMIAARDPEACKAMHAVGLVTCPSEVEATTTVSSRNVTAPKPRPARPARPALKVDCVTTERGTIQPRVTKAIMERYTTEEIMAACG